MISLRNLSVAVGGALAVCLVGALPALAVPSAPVDPSPPSGPSYPCGMGHLISYTVHNDNTTTGGQIGFGPYTCDNPSGVLQPYHESVRADCH